MVDLMLAGDEDRIRRKGVVCSVYDPCCGSGGMLMITKEHVTIGLRKNGDKICPPLRSDAEIHLFGQEVNPETWAVSKSDLFIKDPTGRDADNIAFGSTLSNDRHAQRRFDYLIANLPTARIGNVTRTRFVPSTNVGQEDGLRPDYRVSATASSFS